MKEIKTAKINVDMYYVHKLKNEHSKNLSYPKLIYGFNWIPIKISAMFLTDLDKVFPYSFVGKESAYNAGDPGLIPGLGRSPGEGKGYPLHY